MSFSLSTWAPSTLPTSTTLKSINPTYSSDLIFSYTSALSRAETEADYIELRSLSQIFRGAQASLTILKAQEVLATATDDSIKSYATQAIFNSTLNLKDLAWEENLYRSTLNRPANIIYLVIFAITFFFTALMMIKSRYHWYNITFFCGLGLEFAGFLGRVLSFSDNTNINFYLLQYVGLTIAPAFLMGGIYFLFAQLVVIHGREYSILKPMWYSYLFIACDVVSLLVQAGGGGSASIASKNHKNTRPGTNTMIAGIAFQVFSMSVFLYFWYEFLNRAYFKNSKKTESGSSLSKRSLTNFFKLLLNLPSTRNYRLDHLDQFYNPRFSHIRQRKLFNWFPLAMTIVVVAIYIRCVYRVVELAQGFRGYLITHEVYLMVLDALMIAICGIIFVPFHPVFVLGTKNIVKLATIKGNLDENSIEKTGSENEACLESRIEKTS